MTDWDPNTRACPQCGAEDLPLPEPGSGKTVRHVGTATGSVFLDDDNTILHTCGTLLFRDYALGVAALMQEGV